MLSNNQKKYVNSLKQKKFRNEHNAFVIEGVKLVDEALKSDFEIKTVYAKHNWIEANSFIDAIEVSEKELASISSLKTPNEVLAVVAKKEAVNIDLSGLTIVLDNIQDPGNLGTIIRTADWFGIKNIVCSSDSVEVYNPKVLQATMGSFFRVNVTYCDLVEFFNQNPKLTVYGALLDGDNVYNQQLLKTNVVLLMGNESKGISDNLLPFITNKITIPKIGNAESLNVAIAAAIFSYECMRD